MLYVHVVPNVYFNWLVYRLNYYESRHQLKRNRKSVKSIGVYVICETLQSKIGLPLLRMYMYQ